LTIFIVKKISPFDFYCWKVTRKVKTVFLICFLCFGFLGANKYIGPSFSSHDQQFPKSKQILSIIYSIAFFFPVVNLGLSLFRSRGGVRCI
jgi:nitric oxide reductase large subunit